MIGPPALAGTTGQASVTPMPGAVMTVQVGETLFVTALSVQGSLPDPLKVVVTEQALVGTAYGPALKLVDTPAASVARVKTTVLGTGRSLNTITLVKVKLPALLTVTL